MGVVIAGGAGLFITGGLGVIIVGGWPVDPRRRGRSHCWRAMAVYPRRWCELHKIPKFFHCQIQIVDVHQVPLRRSATSTQDSSISSPPHTYISPPAITWPRILYTKMLICRYMMTCTHIYCDHHCVVGAYIVKNFEEPSCCQ